MKNITVLKNVIWTTSQHPYDDIAPPEMQDISSTWMDTEKIRSLVLASVISHVQDHIPYQGVVYGCTFPLPVTHENLEQLMHIAYIKLIVTLEDHAAESYPRGWTSHLVTWASGSDADTVAYPIEIVQEHAYTLTGVEEVALPFGDVLNQEMLKHGDTPLTLADKLRFSVDKIVSMLEGKPPTKAQAEKIILAYNLNRERVHAVLEWSGRTTSKEPPMTEEIAQERQLPVRMHRDHYAKTLQDVADLVYERVCERNGLVAEGPEVELLFRLRSMANNSLNGSIEGYFTRREKEDMLLSDLRAYYGRDLSPAELKQLVELANQIYSAQCILDEFRNSLRDKLQRFGC